MIALREFDCYFDNYKGDSKLDKRNFFISVVLTDHLFKNLHVFHSFKAMYFTKI